MIQPETQLTSPPISLASRRFLPLLCVQSLGACNDNIYKNALIVLMTYHLSQNQAQGQMLTVLAAFVFILPFFLCSSIAGQLADAWPKHRLLRAVKLAECLIMGMGVLALNMGHQPLLLLTLFLMGAQSALFGPLKYGIPPEHLPKQLLTPANGWIEATTFLAILLGNIISGLLILTPQGITIISLLLLGLALCGYACSWLVPPTMQPQSPPPINWNIVASSLALLRHARQHRTRFVAILGIGWFWFCGASILALLPNIAKYSMAMESQGYTLLLALFSVGIALGSFIAGRQWLSSSTGLVLMGAALLSLAFFGWWGDMRVPMAVCAIATAMGAGLYVVPLYTCMQMHSEADHRARIIASSNMINAALMSLSGLLLLLLTMLQMPLMLQLAMLGIGNVLLAGYMYQQKGETI